MTRKQTKIRLKRNLATGVRAGIRAGIQSEAQNRPPVNGTDLEIVQGMVRDFERALLFVETGDADDQVQAAKIRRHLRMEQRKIHSSDIVTVQLGDAQIQGVTLKLVFQNGTLKETLGQFRVDADILNPMEHIRANQGMIAGIMAAIQSEARSKLSTNKRQVFKSPAKAKRAKRTH